MEFYNNAAYILALKSKQYSTVKCSHDYHLPQLLMITQ